MTRRDVDDEVAALARRQHGAFAARQVLIAGGTHSLIHRRTEAALWIRLDQGVFALPGNPGTWKRQLKAAELGHARAVVSGGAAAVVHGFTGFRPGRPEITVPRGVTHRSSLAVVRRRDGVTTTTLDGFLLTDAAQTLLDVAASTPVKDLSRAVEEAALRGLIGLDHLLARSIDAGRRRVEGAGDLRALLDRLLGTAAVSESELERHLRVAVERAGIGSVLYQAPPPWWPDGPQRVDAWLPEHRTIVEADGRAWHARVEAFERDRARDNLAARHGCRVVRLTWQMLTTGLPATVALLRALPRAAPSNSA